MNDRDSEIVLVASKHLGLIIGKGGATIKEISQDTGCRINISKDDAVNDEVPVTIEGSKKDIESAKAKINEITRRQHKRHQPEGGDRSYGNNDNDRGYNSSSKRPSRRDYDSDDKSWGNNNNDRGSNNNCNNDRGYNNNSNNDRGYNNNSNNDRGYNNNTNNDRGYNNNSNNDRGYNNNSNNDRGYNNNSNNDRGYNNNSNNDRGSNRQSRRDDDDNDRSYQNKSSNDRNNGYSSKNGRAPVNDDHWGGWGDKNKDQDNVDSLIFKADDCLRGNNKFLPQSVDNYVPDDDWGIPSYIEDEKPVRKRPSNSQLKMRSTKDKTFFQVRRDFYVEHEAVAAMTVAEKDKFLVEKNNIMIKEIDTDKDMYCSFGGVGGDEEDLEEKVEIIPVAKIIRNPVRSFNEAFSRYPDILSEIKKQQFDEPSPIQCIAWPVLMSGRDLIGIAQTGTGKTLAFLLPAFIHIEGQPKPRECRQGPTVLILSPTRELAIQIQKEVQKYTYHDIDSVVCYGGADKREQINQLKEFPEIVVGTPGRILDLKDSGVLNLKDVSYLVLDEADRMLDMGFEIQVVNIIYSVRKQRQTVMTSATWPFSVQRIALNHMKDPVQVNVGTLDLNACHSVTQLVEYVDWEGKTRRLIEILSQITPDDKIIIFVARKAQCSDLAFELYQKRCKGLLGPKGAVRACEIHGDLDQSERELALRLMRSGARNVMIATDVASRGLDIPDLTKVINFDFPKNIEEYVHRVGRTGRAGRTGISITFMNRKDWSGAAELIKILEDANQEVPDFLPQLMKQFQEFRLNGGTRGRFGGGGGGGGRRGGGGFGRSGGGGGGGRGRNNYGGDNDTYDFGLNDCDDSSWTDKSKLIRPVTENKYVQEGSSDDDCWGNWNKKSTIDHSPDRCVVADNCEVKPKKLIEQNYPQPTKVINPVEKVEPTKYNFTPFMSKNKDQNIYPVHRNFYREHEDIATLRADEVELILKEKNNIMVQELRTYPAQYNPNNSADSEHSKENKVELLPATAGIPKPIRTFQEAFWQYPDIMAIIADLKFQEPSPIQCIGWPTLLGGRDFIGIAQTGTGKTLTFVLPALVHIEGQTKERKFRRGPTVLILSPTRELAMQIESEVLKIKYKDVKSVCCYGGADKANQIAGLRENPEIIVGTPGRLNDLMEMGYLCLSDVSYLVLDEADRMLDMGFEQQVVSIINCTRIHRQSVMTSATWPESVRMIALMYMDNPVQVNVGSLDLVACKDVVQELRQVDNSKKTETLCDIISGLNDNDKAIVFVTRKKQCRSLANVLDRMVSTDRLGPHASVCEIHGDLDQEARELSLAWFREGRCNILIATNVASRGLDISDVTYVINYDFPKDIEEYVHRVGRTGRAGKQGKAITFMNDMDWRHGQELRNILNQSKQVVPPWLMHLRAMKQCTISSSTNTNNYYGDDCEGSAQALDGNRISSIKNRFSFNDFDYEDDYEDEPASFFDEFQSKLDPTFRAPLASSGNKKKSKGKKKKVFEERVVRSNPEILDELCGDDINDDDNEDFFDEFQKKVDPIYGVDGVEKKEVYIVDDNDDNDDDSWW